MTIWAMILVAVVVLVAIWALMVWDWTSRRITQADFAPFIRDFLIRTENSAFVRLDLERSPIWFSYERLDGTDTRAVLSLRIPRGPLTEPIRADIRSRFNANGFEFEEEIDNPSLLAKINIVVHDIWDESSGTKGALAGRILLGALGISRNAKFKISQQGRISYRAMKKSEYRERL